MVFLIFVSIVFGVLEQIIQVSSRYSFCSWRFKMNVLCYLLNQCWSRGLVGFLWMFSSSLFEVECEN